MYAIEKVEGWARAAQGGDRRAVDALLAATEHVIAAVVRQVSDASEDAREDLAQLARCAVWEAVTTYDPGRSRWYGYALKVIRRAVFREARRARERGRREKQAAGELRQVISDPATPAELVAAAQTAQARLHAERLAAARRIENAKLGSKSAEIAVRLELGATLKPGEPLRWLAVGEADELRIALLTHLLHEHRSRDPRNWTDQETRSVATGARDFFAPTQAGQEPGAPKIGPTSLFGIEDE